MSRVLRVRKDNPYTSGGRSILGILVHILRFLQFFGAAIPYMQPICCWDITVYDPPKMGYHYIYRLEVGNYCVSHLRAGS